MIIKDFQETFDFKNDPITINKVTLNLVDLIINDILDEPIIGII